MKKVIIFLFIFIVLILTFNNEDNVLIPKDSIRFRIIANSNTFEDQQLKWNINKELIPIIVDITSSSSSIEEARNSIYANIQNIDDKVNNYTNDYNINYGQNYFPKKEYKNILYDAGNYESLVITLGSGKGDNWWCVLFPPLCLIESSDNYDNVTYKSYIKEIINRYI